KATRDSFRTHVVAVVVLVATIIFGAFSMTYTMFQHGEPRYVEVSQGVRASQREASSPRESATAPASADAEAQDAKPSAAL
ncbi:MAG: hypothetical protein LBR38_03005, partial [Synergistaceae bacterium]|nr:hypothetical protein [Synergistaceae bacterium]